MTLLPEDCYGVLVTTVTPTGRSVLLQTDDDPDEGRFVTADVTRGWAVYVHRPTALSLARSFHLTGSVFPPGALDAPTPTARLKAVIFPPDDWEPDLSVRPITLDGVDALRVDLSPLPDFTDGDHLLIPRTAVFT